MKTALITILFVGLAALSAAADEFEQPRRAGIEGHGYVWNQADEETRRVLAVKGDAAKGKTVYRLCIGCHNADGSGVAEANYPQLAAQHTSVLIKEMLDVRNGRRDSPTMYPFISEGLVSVEDIAHVAAYLNTLPLPPHNGLGDGSALVHGKTLYQRDCASCHGLSGEGDGAKVFPRLAGQHYRYLRRETIYSRDAVRRNGHLTMVQFIKAYSDRDVEAVSDYLSRLRTPPAK